MKTTTLAPFRPLMLTLFSTIPQEYNIIFYSNISLRAEVGEGQRLPINLHCDSSYPTKRPMRWFFQLLSMPIFSHGHSNNTFKDWENDPWVGLGPVDSLWIKPRTRVLLILTSQYAPTLKVLHGGISIILKSIPSQIFYLVVFEVSRYSFFHPSLQIP